MVFLKDVGIRICDTWKYQGTNFTCCDIVYWLQRWSLAAMICTWAAPLSGAALPVVSSFVFVSHFFTGLQSGLSLHWVQLLAGLAEDVYLRSFGAPFAWFSLICGTAWPFLADEDGGEHNSEISFLLVGPL